MPEPTTDPTPASMGDARETEPLTEERLARIEHLWGGHQAYVREMLAEIRRLRAMKCVTCGKRIGYLNHKGYLLGWGCADAERCDQGLPHRFDTERGEVLVEDSWFKVEDLPDILGNFMRASASQGREAKELSIKLAEARARVGVLEGQLATAQAEVVIRDGAIVGRDKAIDSLEAWRRNWKPLVDAHMKRCSGCDACDSEGGDDA